MDDIKDSSSAVVSSSADESMQQGSMDARAVGNGTGPDSASARPGNTTGGPAGSGGRSHYTIPGILHFLQHEWSRFELERSQWEVEKAELQARIAFLQGERKGQENLKNDLVRRIKMLEFALKQERNKYNKLKYGNDSNAIDAKSAADEESEKGLDFPPLDGDNYIAVSNVNWRQGRQLLRQYLQEIGYTDTIIDVRSNRVRSLLGLNDASSDAINEDRGLAVNGGGGGLVQAGSDHSSSRRGDLGSNHGTSAGSGSTTAFRRGDGTTLAEEMLIDTEAAVMANFDFLSSEAEVDDDEEMGEDNDDGYHGNEMKLKVNKLAQNVSDVDDKETEEVLNEFNFLTNPDTVDSLKNDSNKSDDPSELERIALTEWGIDPHEVERLKDLYKGNSKRKHKGLPGGPVVDFLGLSGPRQNHASVSTGSSTDKKDDLGANLELGELEQLTITNDNESSYDITAPKESFRKTWMPKYTLRSHFDGVRALAFHPIEPVLVTASEDQTLKLWNLQKTVPAKKSASLDVEPVYTFRAHRGPVLSLCVSPSADLIFSGGLDGSVRVWNVPRHDVVDPYESFDPSVLRASFTQHTDAVWGLAYEGSRHQQLLSCSSDGTVKLWRPSNATTPLLKTFVDSRLPTSVDWVRTDTAHMVTAYNANGDSPVGCVIHDVETGKPVVKLESDSSFSPYEMGAITKVVSHPTLPLTITAHKDKQIRIFDNTTGKLTHVMAAHLGVVTSLSVDTNGLYLISGSHDSSIRLWNLETKSCIQEITSHRMKFDESIFDVAFHPSKPFIACAGADALVKVFV